MQINDATLISVLHDIIYKAVGQSGFGADMLDFPTIILGKHYAVHHQYQNSCGNVSKPSGKMQCEYHKGIGLIKDKHNPSIRVRRVGERRTRPNVKWTQLFIISVAPMELKLIFLSHCYRHVAPTEL